MIRNLDANIVLNVQWDLAMLGYRIDVDGLYGPRTDDTVKKFLDDYEYCYITVFTDESLRHVNSLTEYERMKKCLPSRLPTSPIIKKGESWWKTILTELN